MSPGSSNPPTGHLARPTANLRVLFVADTHLGFDEPQQARVERTRRGPDFWANYEAALALARGSGRGAGAIDLVIHGGDLLYRSKVPASLVERAMEPLKAIADQGVPVVITPGNHERSKIPYPLFALHPEVHVLTGPRTVRLETAAGDVAVAGFAFKRGIRDAFHGLLAKTAHHEHADAGVRLLVIHQTVQGATVGPADFTFRGDAETIDATDIPAGFAAVLAGHIHRHQVLRGGLATPVWYPGSIERTSAAERDETKGFLTFTIAPDATTGGRVIDHTFHELPARPLVDVEVPVAGRARADVEADLTARLSDVPPRAVVRLRPDAELPAGIASLFAAARLRELVPPDTVVEWRPPAADDPDGSADGGQH